MRLLATQGHGVFGTGCDGFFADDGDFSIGVGLEFVDGDNHGDTVLTGVLDVFAEVDTALTENINVLSTVNLGQRSTRGDLGTTAVNLEGSNGSHDNDDIRHQS